MKTPCQDKVRPRHEKSKAQMHKTKVTNLRHNQKRKGEGNRTNGGYR
jgi:hypothetical protein